MVIPADAILPRSGVNFLAHCYKFVAVGWQHAKRDDIPDQGFESRFREACSVKLLPGWTVSQHREMNLGLGLDTASGILHEVDIVCGHADLTAIVETKNRSGWPADKNDSIVFFAKIVDYLAANPSLLQRDICPAIISASGFEVHGVAACLGLGIHPIAPGLRPLPLLLHTAQLIQNEIKAGLKPSSTLQDRFVEFTARVNTVAVALEQTWFSKRFGASTESRIVVKAVSPMQTVAMGQEIQQLSSECSSLIYDFQCLKAGAKQ